MAFSASGNLNIAPVPLLPGYVCAGGVLAPAYPGTNKLRDFLFVCIQEIDVLVGDGDLALIPVYAVPELC